MSTATAVAPRSTADDRREAILQAAMEAFAEKGLHGTSTETIARAVGISQPYLFRLYGTKKELFLAADQALLRRHPGPVPARRRRRGPPTCP